MAERQVRGLAEIQKVLDTLPVKLERNVLRGGLRAGMNVVKPEAQSRIHNVSGLLARGLKVGTKVQHGTVIARLRATGRHAHIATWLEYGVAFHAIIARVKKALAFGGTVVRKIRHPGFAPKPFMRPALDACAAAAVVAAANYMKSRLATKHGIDTAYIKVEGDE